MIFLIPLDKILTVLKAFNCSKSKLEQILPVNCKFIRDSTPTLLSDFNCIKER